MQRSSLVEQVTDLLTQRILMNEWKPEERIPSVQKLSAEYGVALPTMREAIRILQERKLVRSRQGAGTFVLPPEPLKLTWPWKITPHEFDDFSQIIEARRHLEHSIVELAVLRATEERLDSVEQAYTELSSKTDDARGFVEADVEFHSALAEAAGNRILEEAIAAIRGPLRRVFLNCMSHTLEAEGSLEVPIKAHHDLFLALRNRDLTAATSAFDAVVTPPELYFSSIAPHPDTDTADDSQFSPILSDLQ